jgi:hypothetical protein
MTDNVTEGHGSSASYQVWALLAGKRQGGGVSSCWEELMPGLGIPYLVAFCAAAACAIAAYVLITTVNHFDPPEVRNRDRGGH